MKSQSVRLEVLRSSLLSGPEGGKVERSRKDDSVSHFWDKGDAKNRLQAEVNRVLFIFSFGFLLFWKIFFIFRKIFVFLLIKNSVPLVRMISIQ